MIQCINMVISGQVQGVFFRASTRKQAKMLGVNGFVRNLEDGRVEVVAQGEKEPVEKLIDWCRQGPGGARVDKVELSEISVEKEFGEFEIRY